MVLLQKPSSAEADLVRKWPLVEVLVLSEQLEFVLSCLYWKAMAAETFLTAVVDAMGRRQMLQFVVDVVAPVALVGAAVLVEEDVADQISWPAAVPLV